MEHESPKNRLKPDCNSVAFHYNRLAETLPLQQGFSLDENAYDRLESRSISWQRPSLQTKKIIIETFNNNAEPPSELMTKLFPGLAEKFDVAKLDRAKIVTLEYVVRRNRRKNQGDILLKQSIN